MKPNPCKRCGKEPISYRCKERRRLVCCDAWVESETAERTFSGWNAMNPDRQSDCPIESQEPVEQACGNCRFFNEYHCHRNPPTALCTATGVHTFWPSIELTTPACGEWRAK